MKNLILIFTASLFSSQFSIATIAKNIKTIEQKLMNAKEFQFLHCKPSETKTTDLVVHYIIDIQNNSVNQLFVSPGLSEVKGKKLQKLTLIDSQLTEINADSDSNLSFNSVKNDLKFKLIIQDNDGLFLSGNIYQKHQTVPIICKDITVE